MGDRLPNGVYNLQGGILYLRLATTPTTWSVFGITSEFSNENKILDIPDTIVNFPDGVLANVTEVATNYNNPIKYYNELLEKPGAGGLGSIQRWTGTSGVQGNGIFQEQPSVTLVPLTASVYTGVTGCGRMTIYPSSLISRNQHVSYVSINCTSITNTTFGDVNLYTANSTLAFYNPSTTFMNATFSNNSAGAGIHVRGINGAAASLNIHVNTPTAAGTSFTTFNCDIIVLESLLSTLLIQVDDSVVNTTFVNANNNTFTTIIGSLPPSCTRLAVPSTTTYMGSTLFKNTPNIRLDIPASFLNNTGTLINISTPPSRTNKLTFPPLYGYVQNLPSALNSVTNNSFTLTLGVIPRAVASATQFYLSDLSPYAFSNPEASNTVNTNIIPNVTIKTVQRPDNSYQMLSLIRDGSYSFHPSITRLNLPLNVSFEYTNLVFARTTSLTINGISGNAITTIPDGFFNSQTSLTSVTLGPSITTIGTSSLGAFANCSALSTFTKYGTTATTINGASLQNCISTFIINLEEGSNVNMKDVSLVTITNLTINGITSSGSASTATIIPANFIDVNTLYSLTTVTLGSSITSVGASAFAGCSNLATLNLPSSVTSISASAFKTGRNLTINGANSNTTIPNSLFLNNTGLASVTTGSGITTIGPSAFSGCSALATFTATNTNFATIGASAFNGCSSTFTLNLPSTTNPITISNTAFSTANTNLTVGGGITTIADGSFSGNTTLKTVTLNGITTLVTPATPTGVFSGCSTLESFTATALTTIPTKTFHGCKNTFTLTLPLTVTSISNTAFNTANTSLTINGTASNGIRTIPASSFSSNATLTSVTINSSGSSITTIGTSAFSGCTGLATFTANGNAFATIGATAFYDCSNSFTLTLPSSVTSISNTAFTASSARSLNLTINGTSSNGIVTIPDSSFLTNTTLTSVTINSTGSSITTLGTSAFSGCSGLATFTANNGLTTIGTTAFNGCSSTFTLNLPSTVLSIPSTAFNTSTTLTISGTNVATPIATISSTFFPSSTNYLSSLILGTNITSLAAPVGTSGVFNNCTNLATFTINNNTAIPDYAFANCSTTFRLNLHSTFTSPLPVNTFKDLTDLTIGGTITAIPPNFCENNTKLKTVRLAVAIATLGITAFSGCTGLESFTAHHVISNNITSIPASAFSNGKNTFTLTLPSSVTSISNTAFTATSGRTLNLTINGTATNGITTIPTQSFLNNSTLTLVTINSTGSSITTIGTSAFSGCSALATFTANTGLTTIDTTAFYDCSNPFTLTLPSSVTSISNTAFTASSARNLNLTINGTASNGIVTIPARSFLGNTTLRSVTLGTSISVVDGNGNPEDSVLTGAFANCSNLTSFTANSTNFESIKAKAFNGCNRTFTLNLPSTTNTITIADDAFSTPNTNLTVGGGITRILDGSFFNNISLVSVKFGTSITTLLTSTSYNGSSYGTFAGCTNLTSFTANSITTIPTRTFADCSATFRLNLSSTITNISDTAFSPNTILTIGGTNVSSPITAIPANFLQNSITLKTIILDSSVTSVGAEAFKGCSGLNVFTANGVPPENGKLGESSLYGTKLFQQTIKDLTVQGFTHYELFYAGLSMTDILSILVCFNENTKILCLVNGEEKEVLIQNIRNGVLVKTLRSGYKPVCMIGTTQMYNPGTNERFTDRLYICKKEKYPELNEDLIITGCHSILVDDITAVQREKIMKQMKDIYVTEGKYRLNANLDDRAEPYNCAGKFNIYHIALENEFYVKNYGVYANGLLVESCSKRYLKELSNMRLL